MFPSEIALVDELSDPMEAAHIAGLRYVTDQMPGIQREKVNGDFQYRYPTGKAVHEKVVLARLKALAIPPAWRDVWICPDPCGHLQATGRDARGRKQSRYHRRWREVRDETKYTRMIGFARALPGIRRRVSRDLALQGLSRAKVLAAVVRLLELSLIRVGNKEYARNNDSFGLTTLRNRHVNIRGEMIRFHFRGKSGKWHEVDIRNRGLARVIKRCHDLPGYELFQYVDGEGNRQKVDSEDVNDYLRESSGEDYTAKDFRTWAGTVLGAVALQNSKLPGSQTQAKKNIVQAIELVAARLGNTVAVCRKCYIHPEVITAYLDGTLIAELGRCAAWQSRSAPRGLQRDEMAVLRFLKRRAKRQREQNQHLPELLGKSIQKASRLVMLSRRR